MQQSETPHEEAPVAQIAQEDQSDSAPTHSRAWLQKRYLALLIIAAVLIGLQAWILF